MRKLLFAGGVALGVSAAGSLYSQAETNNDFLFAAHIPSESCREDVAQALGDSVLQAVFIDAVLAVGADKKTSDENNATVDPVDISHLPTIRQYTQQYMTERDRGSMPESNVEFRIATHENSWEFSPEIFDRVVQKVLQTKSKVNSLQNEVYDCFEEELYESHSLQNDLLDLVLFDEDDCLSVNKVAPREEDLCTADGRHTGNGETYIAKPGYQSASKALLHEFMHWLQDKLEAEPSGEKALKRREYAATQFAEIGLEIMRESDEWILKPNDSCQARVAFLLSKPYNYPCFVGFAAINAE